MDVQLDGTNGVRLAIEGCGHGTLHAIYASIEEACKRKGWPGVDLLIIGGDFQSVRNAHDLECVSMPAKYRSMCDFHEYYSGRRRAPYLTIFVGGNHEASNFLFELYYGGWVAPNIYYMGAANVLSFGPLRIAGLSGIWKGFDYRKPHFERLPYNESDTKSIYHVRELDIRKLLQIQTQVDVGISHDWPQGVEWKGDWEKLFRRKKFFEEDARSGRLGSVAAKQVVEHLRPRYWFSAHLHCKFAAVIAHDKAHASEHPLTAHSGAPSSLDRAGPYSSNTAASTEEPQTSNADEIDIDMDSEGETPVSAQNAPDSSLLDAARAALPASFAPAPSRPDPPRSFDPPHPPGITNTTTSFLALDKCLPNRDFLQLTFIPTPAPPTRPMHLSYDREWLSITRASARCEPPVFGGDPSARVPPARPAHEYAELVQTERGWIDGHFPEAGGSLRVPENWVPVAPFHGQEGMEGAGPREYADPQTAAFCRMLGIENPLEIGEGERLERMERGPRAEDGGGYRGRGGRGRGGFERGRGRGSGNLGGGMRRGGRGRGR